LHSVFFLAVVELVMLEEGLLGFPVGFEPVQLDIEEN
jgi:hypothetical protein